LQAKIKMHNSKETILELEHITKRYRTRGSFFGAHGKEVIALNALSIQILKGEIFGLVGESGSGKTTAGRLIVRLEKPEEGKIYLNGSEMTGLEGKALKDFPRKVQMIFQDPYQSLNPQLSVFDTISEPLIIHKTGNAGAREDAVWQVMKSVGLSPPEDFVNRYPHQLSGGQRQRVAIARAMVLNPDFAVADEPTSMLDASISAQIFNILLDMREKFQVTFLFITHSLSAARYLCDRIAVIYKGSIMEIGAADQVIQNPKHPYTQALIDALPKFGQCDEVKHYGTLLMAERKDAEPTGCPFFPRCGVAQRDKCSRERPLLKEIDDSHSVACFFAESGIETPSESNKCYYG
jgi:oligopeptide/dipeptide ABC transporter ATP-binding protein